MPNYFVTNTARFNPFTYQELATPLIQATQQHLAMEEALSSLDDGTLATYLKGESQDSPYVRGYSDLTSRIENLSNRLSSQGLDASMMREAMKLKGDYKKFSTPVEAAGKRKAADVAAYNKMYASDPTLIGDNPNDISLQQYIDNPNYSAQYTSGKIFQSYGATLGAQMASQFSPVYKPVQGGKFYEVQTKKVASMEEIKNNPQYKSAIDNLMVSQGYDPSKNDTLTQRVRNEIENGMFMGMQDAGITRVANPGWGRTSSSRESGTTDKVILKDVTIGENQYKVVKRGNDLVKIDLKTGGETFVTDKDRDTLGIPKSGGSKKKGAQVTHRFATGPMIDGQRITNVSALNTNEEYQTRRTVNVDFDIDDSSDTAINEYFNSDRAPKLTDESYEVLASLLHRTLPNNNREKYELLKDAIEAGIHIEVTPIKKGKQHIYTETLSEKSIHNDEESEEEEGSEQIVKDPTALARVAAAIKEEHQGN